MPRLTQVMIDLDFKADEIVETLRTSIIECGCVSIKSESERYNLPIEQIRNVFAKMQGVTCDDDKCCITNMPTFLKNLKNIAGGD